MSTASVMSAMVTLISGPSVEDLPFTIGRESITLLKSRNSIYKVNGDQLCMWSLFTNVRLFYNLLCQSKKLLWQKFSNLRFIMSLSFTHLSTLAMSIMFLLCTTKMSIRPFTCLSSTTNKSSTSLFTTRSQGMRTTSQSMS